MKIEEALLINFVTAGRQKQSGNLPRVFIEEKGVCLGELSQPSQ